MYLDHFGLHEAPFKITPNTGFFYPGAERGATLDALVYAIEQGEGIIKVTGEVGSGKTLLCRMLAEKLRTAHDLVYLANPHISPQEVLTAIAYDLKLPLAADASITELTHGITHSLLQSHANGRRTILLVEEAQGMPLETLEEIRLLTNLETAHEKLLQIVLFGQPELDENLRQATIRQLNERITQHFSLRPLTPEEARQYLDHRLRSAGYRGPELFPSALVRELNRHAHGLSRRLNILADKTLLAAYAENTHTLTLNHVRAAVADSPFTDKRRQHRTLALSGGLLLALLLTAALGMSAIRQPNATVSALPLATPHPAPPAVAPTDIFTARLHATERWLASTPDKTFTLQLFSAPDQADLTQRLTKLAADINPTEVFVYAARVRNNLSYNVTYGSYSTRSEAAAAITRLPALLKKNQPLIRTAGGIRKERNAAVVQGAHN